MPFDHGDSEGDSGQVGCLQLAVDRTKWSQQDLTTVVVRNIPRHYSASYWLSEIQLVGFMNFVTLVSLPQDGEKAANRGYSFVNFQNSDAAFCFLKAMNGHQWHDSPDSALADWAIVQGHDATIALAQAPWKKRRGQGRRTGKKAKESEDGKDSDDLSTCPSATNQGLAGSGTRAAYMAACT